jgi:diguanylate cyclase (GGDEF)-like protein
MARADAVARVLLVGSTGLDVTLRQLGSLQIIRARNALEAIGELAEAHGADGPKRTVVIVGTDADHAAEANLGTGADELVDGLRLVDPHVRVLLMLSDDKALPTPGDVAAYDGFVTPLSPVEELMRAIRGGPVEADRHGPSGASLDAGPGDTAIVTTLLRGMDITTTALPIIEQRLGNHRVQFIGAGHPAPEGGVPVWVPGSESFGTLVAPDVDRTVLEVHAAWLGGWLRLQQQQTQLRRAAFTDPLTGAWNRRYFDRFLGSAIDQARTSRLSLTLMLFDIDDFKRFNEQFGHDAADEILVETVRLLQSVIRPTDRVCRIGGDEFAVIFYEPAGPRTPGSVPPTSVAHIAERFQKQICDQRFPKLGIDAPGTLTVSGGIATYPWDGTTAADLVRRADELSRESKRDGKNAIRMGPFQGESC